MVDPAVVIVAGVRPQYVKTKALLWLLEKHQPAILRHTVTFDVGQHYTKTLADDVMRDLGFSFTYRMAPVDGRMSRGAILGRAIEQLSVYFDKLDSKPTVVVFGDAASVVAGAFAAYNAQLTLVHIEAGARRDPRELEHNNSIVVDQLAQVRMAYSQRAVDALAAENHADGTYLVGDVSYDWYSAEYGQLMQDSPRGRYAPVLVSMHRPSNMDVDTLGTVAKALVATGREVRWLRFPRTEPYLDYLEGLGVRVVGPFNHHDTIRELSRSAFILTDSGGLSREAHYFRCPVIMRRDLGGWPELAASGFLYSLTARSRVGVEAAIRWAEATRMPELEHSPLVIQGGGTRIADLIAESVQGAR